MSLQPISDAPAIIQIHIATVLLAICLTPCVLLTQKGSVLHRRLGTAWVLAMACTAFSSLFVYTIRMMGPFSPIHLLSLLTFVMLFLGWRAARQHQIIQHKSIMISLIVLALAGAGVFTLMPGRIMHKVFWGQG
jgi:uncharacterized membrane protein